MAFKTPLVSPTRFPADLPELPVRHRDDPGGPTFVARAAVSRQDTCGLVLVGTTQTGEQVTITVTAIAPGIVRVLLEDAHPDPHRVALARVPADCPAVTSLDINGEQARLALDDLVVQIHFDPFQLAFYRPDGRLLLAQDYTDADVTGRLNALPFGFSDVEGQRAAFHDTFAAEPDEHFYGFGEKFTGFDKRGQQIAMWHYDALGVGSERAYKNVPFFVSTRGYGILVDSARATRFDMVASSHSVFSFAVPDSALDYYVIAGPDLKSVVARYSALVSLPNLPPKWAFGLWMSSGFKEDNAEAVLQRAREMRDHDVPCDVMHLDCYWQRFGRWSEMIWDPAMFPDPAEMLERLNEMSFKVSLWINPYLGTASERFVEARDKGYLLKTPDGSAWVGDLWNGHHPPVGIIDMTNPEAVAWFKELLRPNMRMGVSVYKTDFGEAIPLDVVAYNGMTGEELHNIYTLLYNDAVVDVTVEETGRASLVWARSTYTGGQRHGAQWGGDPNCTYTALASTLRGGLSLAMCGHGLWSHDIGGFHGQPTPELYIRWAQMGLFSPLSRAHGRTTRLSWDYGEEAERIFREYVRLRYRLLPYIYTYARLAARTGLPLIRPMVLEFPDDPCTYAMDLQYMFGEHLLVAPLYNAEGRRPVYFPAGRWVDFWTHEVIVGPQTRHVEVPLEVLPLYVRADTLIPTIEPPDRVGEEPFENVTFDGYVLERGAFALEDTDGTTSVSVRFHGTQVYIETVSPKPRLAVRLFPLAGRSAVEAVQVNGSLGTQVSAAEALAGSGTWFRAPEGSITIML